MINLYLNFWKKFLNVTDKANRGEYWMALLINNVLLVGILGPQLGLVEILGLVLFIPNITLLARRMVDLGRTWKSILLFLVPFYNIYLLILVLFAPGKE
jgi:uncharacterized membrane protein YhaH (DUF805 family)